MKFIFLILIIIALIIIVDFSCKYSHRHNNRHSNMPDANLETFDNKITQMKEDNCGNACTKFLDCKGFAYDNNTNICWLSKAPINFKPLTSLYAFEYNSNLMRCNKMKPIYDTLTASNDDFKLNATYQCKNNDTATTNYYKLYDDKASYLLNKLDDIKNIDVDAYSIYDVPYPNSFMDDITYNNIKYIVSPDTNINLMQEKPEEYLGQYQFEHKCVANISLNDCLQSCIKNNSCKGTEWNPYFIDKDNKSFKNICCPKININNVIPRRQEHENGKFYLKTIMPEIELKNNLVNKMNANSLVFI